MWWSWPVPFHAIYSRPWNSANDGPTLVPTSGTLCWADQLCPSKKLV